MSADDAVAGFLESVAEGHEVGDRVDLHDGDAEPLHIVVPPGTSPKDYYLLFRRLENLGYQVDKEWSDGNEVTQAAYRLHFPDERSESL